MLNIFEEKKFIIVAKTFFGLEKVLEQELIELGATEVKQGLRNVSFTGDMNFLYKVNMACSTALRFIVSVHNFTAHNETELYNAVKSMPWHLYLNTQTTFAIDATTNSDIFTHSKYVALKVKDAIADACREKYGARPNVDVNNPTFKINVHVAQNNISIGLDASGNSLHLRGYKQNNFIAPINEVLAAGILKLSGWQGQCNFLDPMCGSGTILIEAGLMAHNIAPNLHKDNFAFMQWPQYDVELHEEIKQSLLVATQDFNYTISGSDVSKAAVEKTLSNCKNAGLGKAVQVKQQNFFMSNKQNDTALHLVFNPPYNERMDIFGKHFYKDLGNTLKQQYSNTNAWFITADANAIKEIGLRPSRKIKLFNGALETLLLNYPMYAGSKKDLYKND